MKNGDKHYIKLFGINFLKIKKINNQLFEVYLLGFPLLSVKIVGNKSKINLLLLKKIVWHYEKKYSSKKLAALKKRKKDVFIKFKNGEKLKILLQASRPGTWNFDTLYNLLKNDERFEPIPVIMPDIYQGREPMLKYLESSEQELQERGVPFISGFNLEKNAYLDVKNEINPDIILYVDFWKPHFPKGFYITEFPDKIAFLSEYGYSVMQDELTCNFELNNLVDIYFRPSSLHLDMAKKLMNNKGQNVVITGSPKLDPLFDKTDNPDNDPWKPQSKPKKRIIWAPHHNRTTPKNMYSCDAFWEIYDFMLEIAEKYKDEIQFAFRPHPMLKAKAVKYWGEYAANNYYKKWQKLENCQFSEGDFIDLFSTSDAMIMDCCSFLAEYTAAYKPLLYTRTKTSKLNLNEFGEECFKTVYDTGDNLEDGIIDFIDNVVLKGDDYKKEERKIFVDNFIKPAGSTSASENMYNEIIKYLENGLES